MQLFLLNYDSVEFILFDVGLAQCTELCNQLRGRCGERQVNGANIGLQHNLGLGGACVVGLYKLGFPPQKYVNILVDLSIVNCWITNKYLLIGY